MEKDAASAGVAPVGGLFNTAEIKILICYILAAIGEPVPGQSLANLLHYEGIANYFEVTDAIASLAGSGQIKLHSKEEDTYIITDRGRNVADTLKTSLSHSVRERACTATIKMVSRFKNARDTDIKISREGENTFITCSALDGDYPFMSVKLLVTDESQAQCIKEKFLNDPSGIYSGIIELLTK